MEPPSAFSLQYDKLVIAVGAEVCSFFQTLMLQRRTLVNTGVFFPQKGQHVQHPGSQGACSVSQVGCGRTQDSPTNH
jgi:hypothetical protein